MPKGLKITFYIIGGIILLILGLVVFLNLPVGQNFVRQRAEAYLRKKLKTEVHIGHLGYGLPKYIVLDNALFLDQKRDTLLAIGSLKVDLNMMQLFHHNVDIQQIVMSNTHSHIYRTAPDTNFNFTYIINAFTSPSNTTKSTDTSSSLTFHLDRVKLDKIRLKFDDYSGGIQFASDLDHLDLRMKELDLDHMLFHVKDLDVTGLETVFMQDTAYLPPIPKDTIKSRIKVIADDVELNKVNFKYNNNLNKFLFAMQLGSLQLQLNKYDRDYNIVDIKKLAIKNSDGRLWVGKSSTAPSPIDTIVKIDTTEGWFVNARDVTLAGINFKMDNENEPKQPVGLDYSHLNVHNLGLNVQDLKYSNDTVAGNLKHFEVKEQSGLDVNELRTVFNYNSEGVILSNLYAKTPYTLLQNYVEVHYPSLEAVQKRAQLLRLKVNIVNSVVGMHDAILFVPELQKQPLIRQYRNARLQLDATADGMLSDLNITHLYAKGLGNTEIALRGHIGGMPDANKLTYNLHIAKFNSTRNDLLAILPRKTIPDNIRVPDRFSAVGQIAGNTKDINTDMLLVSSDGSAHLKGVLLTSPGPGRERYDMIVRTSQLNIGRIMKMQPMLGAFTVSGTVKGQSFDIKTMSAAAEGTITSAFIDGYRYHDVTFNGKVVQEKADVSLTSADPNLHLQLNGHGDFSGKYPAILANAKVDSIDLQALKLYSSPLKIRGNIHADFPELNPDYPRGNLVWRQAVILADGHRYFIDSVYALSRPSADTGQNIYLNLDVADAHITGKTPLTKIGAIIQDHINRHYTSAPNDSLKINLANITKKRSKGDLTPKQKAAAERQQIRRDTMTIPPDYNLNLVAHVYDKPLIRNLVPGLTSFDSVNINGSLTPRNLTLNVLVPQIAYNYLTVQNAKAEIRGTDSALTYKVTADQISQSQYALYYADIHGSLDKSVLTANVSLSDKDKKERFALKADLVTAGDTQVVHLLPGLKLDYNVWDVNQPNRIVFNKGGFYVSNFQIANQGQIIRANNPVPRINTPLRVDISNFLLANLTDIVSKTDTLPANGLLSGTIMFERTMPTIQMTSNLQIQNLSIFGDTVGNVQLNVSNKTEDQLDTKVTLTGYGNDISLSGIYYLKPPGYDVLNFNVDVRALAVRSFEGALLHQIKNSSGYLRGHLVVQGKLTDPHISGELRTDNLKTTVAMINSPFTMPSEKIEFSTYQLSVNNFTILDSAGNKAHITGTLGTVDLMDMDLDFKITADNWRAIHSTAKDYKEFYGDLYVSTNLRVTGTTTAPVVDGNLNILKGTKLTVLNPSQQRTIQSSKGIVEFVNMRDSSMGVALMPTADTVKPKHKLAAGTDISVNVTIDKNAEFNIIIDEATGDFVTMHGEAYINTAIVPGGAMEVTGTYLIHSGKYQMNYNFIKRSFQIQDGSMITFGGDPMTSTMLDITARYEARIPAYDLVSRQVPDPAQLVYFKQGLPFDVLLHMKGNMQTPSFTFDVVLPENKIYPLSADQIDLVQARLSQLRMDTSELNKQVFAVLVLGRFVSDDPFTNSTAQGLGFSAVQSVSTFIGEQLNEAANRLIKGVDLSVDLATTEDYTTGSMRRRTDLNVAASKRILNDRLKLTVGNDFEVEGPQTNGSKTSALPSNLAADYLLSGDGRYTVRLYQRSYDVGVLQGYVTETGLNFIVSLDYNRFRNVLNGKRRHKNQTLLKPKTDSSQATTRISQ